MSDIHKHELIRRVAESSKYSRYAVEGILNETIEVIAAALADGEDVVWTGLGRFEWRERSPHGGVNPKTGERIVIPARRSLGCTMGESFKRRVAALQAVDDEAAAD